MLKYIRRYLLPYHTFTLPWAHCSMHADRLFSILFQQKSPHHFHANKIRQQAPCDAPDASPHTYSPDRHAGLAYATPPTTSAASPSSSERAVILTVTPLFAE